jgi:hypothetical protein
LFLATWLDRVRFSGGKSTLAFIVGIIAGIALDTALNSTFLTYDMAWRRDWVAILIIATWILWDKNARRGPLYFSRSRKV